MSKKQNDYNPYKIDKLANIPAYIKVSFLKFWATGASFFFTYSVVGIDELDRLVALWLLLSLIVEYLINKIILFMNNDKTPTLFYLSYSINRKSIFSLLASFLYNAIMLFLIFLITEKIIARLGISVGMILFGSGEGIDPITFGLLYVLLDYIWLWIKYGWKTFREKGEKNEI